MFSRLRRGLGLDRDEEGRRGSTSHLGQPSRSSPGEDPASDQYCSLMIDLQEAVKQRNYPAAAELAKRSLGVLPGFVSEWRAERGSFEIQSIPALEVGGTMLALQHDRDGSRSRAGAPRSP